MKDMATIGMCLCSRGMLTNKRYSVEEYTAHNILKCSIKECIHCTFYMTFFVRKEVYRVAL